MVIGSWHIIYQDHFVVPILMRLGLPLNMWFKKSIALTTPPPTPTPPRSPLLRPNFVKEQCYFEDKGISLSLLGSVLLLLTATTRALVPRLQHRVT